MPNMQNNHDQKTARRRRRFIGVICTMTAIILVSIVYTMNTELMNKEAIGYKQIIALLGMIFDSILFISCYFNNRKGTRECHYFEVIVALLFFDIFFSGVLDTMAGTAALSTVMIVILTLVEIMSTLVHLLFWLYLCSSLPANRIQKYFTRWIEALSLLYFAALCVNLFTGIFFYADSNGTICYPGEAIEIAIYVAYYISFLVYVFAQKCPRKKKLAIASFSVFPLLIFVVYMIWRMVGITATILSITYVFILLASYVVFLCDYIDGQELYLRQQVEMSEQLRKQTELQTSLMLSQIRPHFLYNALTAIRNLVKTEPDTAYTVIGYFAEYLRANMDALGGERMISFDKELEHIKTYLMLEQLRFGDELRVEYDIRYTDFSLPALTVQPIVENAVKYGATMNENGGVVKIKSIKNKNGGVTVEITDNGPGFDCNVPPDDGRNHFGLSNVRKCLATRNCGELHISSTPGVGTTVTILIGEDK